MNRKELLLAGLTYTQIRVYEHAISGKKYKEVATVLGVSIYAVKSQMSVIYKKLGVRNKAELLFKTKRCVFCGKVS